jgi:hypothetical protein
MMSALFFFFVGLGGWIQGFVPARQTLTTWVTPPALSVSVIFGDRSHSIPRVAWTSFYLWFSAKLGWQACASVHPATDWEALLPSWPRTRSSGSLAAQVAKIIDLSDHDLPATYLHMVHHTTYVYKCRGKENQIQNVSNYSIQVVHPGGTVCNCILLNLFVFNTLYIFSFICTLLLMKQSSHSHPLHPLVLGVWTQELALAR